MDKLLINLLANCLILNLQHLRSMSHKPKVLLHLPIFISPDALNGSTGRILAMLKYFHDRRDRLAVDAIVANQLGWQEWSEYLQRDMLRFGDNIFIYCGECNGFDFVCTRIHWIKKELARPNRAWLLP